MLDVCSKRSTPSRRSRIISRGEVAVLDVREPREWSEGHIAGARLVPLGEFRANPMAALPHDGVVFVCAAGILIGFVAAMFCGMAIQGWASRAGSQPDSDVQRPVSSV